MVKEKPIIVVDTREQTPFTFKNYDVDTVREKLDYGDYSIRGFEKLVAVERKSTQDFVVSVTREAERFKKVLDGMSRLERKMIIVESTYEGIMTILKIKEREGYVTPVFGRTFKVPPAAINGAITSIMARYGIPIFFARSPEEAEFFTYNFLKKYFNMKRKG